MLNLHPDVRVGSFTGWPYHKQHIQANWRAGSRMMQTDAWSIHLRSMHVLLGHHILPKIFPPLRLSNEELPALSLMTTVATVASLLCSQTWTGNRLRKTPSSVIWQCSIRSIPILWTSFSQQKVTYNLRQKPWNTLNILAPLPSPSLLQCYCSQWNSKM